MKITALQPSLPHVQAIPTPPKRAPLPLPRIDNWPVKAALVLGFSAKVLAASADCGAKEQGDCEAGMPFAAGLLGILAIFLALF